MSMTKVLAELVSGERTLASPVHFHVVSHIGEEAEV